jgi:hypothetical protein
VKTTRLRSSSSRRQCLVVLWQRRQGLGKAWLHQQQHRLLMLMPPPLLLRWRLLMLCCGTSQACLLHYAA